MSGARWIFFLAVLTVLLTVGASLAASTGLSAIPEVNVNESDLSTQVFNKIFGQGWANLASKIGSGTGDASDGPTLIFTLLGTLNSLCAIAVAWLVIMTLIVGSVGAASEGRALAGKHSSPWVPVRFSFSFAAIAPVFMGLNAMQILILAGIGVSVDMANTAWEKGLAYVAQYGTITADVPQQVHGTARNLSAGAMRSQSLMAYLARQSGCQFGNIGDWEDAGDSWIWYYSIPGECLAGNPQLQKGDLGGFRVYKAKLGDKADQAKVVDKSRTDAIIGVVEAVNDAALKMGEKTFTKEDHNAVFAAANAYTTAVAQGLAQIAQAADPSRQEGLESFVNMASDRGWMMAGSYYWVLVDANARVVSSMAETTEYINPAWDALISARILYRDWDTFVEPNLKEVEQALRANPGEVEHNVILAAGGGPSVGNFFSFFAELPSRFLADLSQNSPDAILTYSNAARTVLVGIEGAVAAVIGLKTLAAGATGWANSIYGAIGNFFSGGALSAGAGAGKSLGDTLFVLVMVAALPLYMVFALFAFMIPAIPFITWVAAVVGWIVLSVEAVVAAPLWLVGHALPEGDGFAGMSGRAGYALFLSVLLRPVLLVLSMFLCMILMCSTGFLIQALFAPFVTGGRVAFTVGNFGLVNAVALMIILGTVITTLTWKMFDLTTAMPDRIIRWVGQLLATLGDEGRGMPQEMLQRARSEGQSMITRGSHIMGERRKARREQANAAGRGAEENAREGSMAREANLQMRDVGDLE